MKTKHPVFQFLLTALLIFAGGLCWAGLPGAAPMSQGLGGMNSFTAENSESQIRNPASLGNVSVLSVSIADTMLLDSFGDNTTVVSSAGTFEPGIAVFGVMPVFHAGVFADVQSLEIGYAASRLGGNLAISIKDFTIGLGLSGKKQTYKVYSYKELEGAKSTALYEDSGSSLDVNLGFLYRGDGAQFSFALQNMELLFLGKEDQRDSRLTSDEYYSSISAAALFTLSEKFSAVSGLEYIQLPQSQLEQLFTLSLGVEYRLIEMIAIQGHVNFHNTFDYYSGGGGVEIRLPGNLMATYATGLSSVYGLKEIPQHIGVMYHF